MHVPAQSYIFADMKQTPKEILTEAKHLIDVYGNRLKYIGEANGQKAWLFMFPDDVTVGFPFLYLLVKGKALEVTGPSVFDFLDLYAENLEALGIK